jgi:hypothetical protein
LYCFLSHAQASPVQPVLPVSAADKISVSSLQDAEKQYDQLEQMLLKQSDKLLKRLQKQEARLQKHMQGKDSLLSKSLFSQSQQQYQALQAGLHSPLNQLQATSLKEYIPGLDSVQTAMRFLEQSQHKLSSLSPAQLKQVTALGNRVQSLQARLQQAEDIKAFIRERKELLQQQVDKLGLTRQFSRMNKEVYYYQQRLTEYKTLLHDKEKLEEKALSALRELPAFKDFMQKNSYLSQLFPLPGSNIAATGSNGLQTREQVQALISQRLGSAATGSVGGGGMNSGNAYVQQQLQSAQSQLAQVKDKLNQLGGGSGDLEMPDFKPNGQKTKTFLQRLEYGFNIQSQNTRGVLPATTDMGLSLGYKLSDRMVVGVGGSYKIGWGSLFNHIRLSNQGMGLRSFVDIKAKGSFWLSGGYELNYLQGLDSLSRTYSNIDKWQRSGLIGITKKYKVGKKEGRIQLLWDFLSAGQVPKAQAIKFRVGYSF